MPDTVIAGRYRLDELLGRGAMSEVWRARGSRARPPRRDQAARAERGHGALRARGARGRLARAPEHHAALRLRRVRRPPVHGARVRPRRNARGAPARPEAAARRRDACAIAAGIAAGLAHAHARGVVHRDLKPANVLFDEEGRAEARRLRHRAHGGGRGNADRGRHGARHRCVHLAGAGDGRAGDRGVRRLLVRRHPLPHAHRAAAVRVERPDAARASMHRDEHAAADRVDSAPDAPAALESTAIAALAKDPRRPAARRRRAARGARRSGGQRPDDRDDRARGEDATQVLPAAPAARRRGEAYPAPPPRAQTGAAHRRRRCSCSPSPAARSPTR